MSDEVVEQNTERGILRPPSCIAYYMTKGLMPNSRRPFQRFIFKFFREDKNQLIVMPTGYGKTMIADFIAQYYLCKGFKVMFCVPFIQLMAEQYKEAEKKWPPFFKGEQYQGFYKRKKYPRGTYDNSMNADIMFCTFERARGILAESGKKEDANKKGDINGLKLIVLDEVHIINDIERGPIVDWLITIAKAKGIHLVGLTGTLETEGAISLAEHMDADLFYTKKRSTSLPIRLFYTNNPIFETKVLPEELKRYYTNTLWEFRYFKDGINYYDRRSKTKRPVLRTADLSFASISDEQNKKMTLSCTWLDEYIPEDTAEYYNYLSRIIEKEVNKKDGVKEVYKNGVLVYVTSKRTLTNIVGKGGLYETIINSKSQQNVNFEFDPTDTDGNGNGNNTIEEPKSIESNFILPVVKCTPDIQERRDKEARTFYGENRRLIKYGIAVHHADIPSLYERDKIIKLFEEKVIRVIFCTSTLSAGINLSNLTLVLVTGMWRTIGAPVSMNEIIQTCGRAGRTPGYPGEAWVFCSLNDMKLYRNYSFNMPTKFTEQRFKIPLIYLASGCGVTFCKESKKELFNPGDLKDRMEYCSTAQKSADVRNSYINCDSWVKIKLPRGIHDKRKEYSNNLYPPKTCKDATDMINFEYMLGFVANCSIPLLKSFRCEDIIIPFHSTTNQLIIAICQLIEIFHFSVENAIMVCDPIIQQKLLREMEENHNLIIKYLEVKNTDEDDSDQSQSRIETRYKPTQLLTYVAKSGVAPSQVKSLQKRDKIFQNFISRVFPQQLNKKDTRILIFTWLSCMFIFGPAKNQFSILSNILSRYPLFTGKLLEQKKQFIVKYPKDKISEYAYDEDILSTQQTNPIEDSKKLDNVRITDDDIRLKCRTVLRSWLRRIVCHFFELNPSVSFNNPDSEKIEGLLEFFKVSNSVDEDNAFVLDTNAIIIFIFSLKLFNPDFSLNDIILNVNLKFEMDLDGFFSFDDKEHFNADLREALSENILILNDFYKAEENINKQNGIPNGLRNLVFDLRRIYKVLIDQRTVNLENKIRITHELGGSCSLITNRIILASFRKFIMAKFKIDKSRGVYKAKEDVKYVADILSFITTQTTVDAKIGELIKNLFRDIYDDPVKFVPFKSQLRAELNSLRDRLCLPLLTDDGDDINNIKEVNENLNNPKTQPNKTNLPAVLQGLNLQSRRRFHR